MTVHALVPAAGSGSRLGGKKRKQYLLLDEYPVLVHTLRRLASQPEISSIHLIVPPGEENLCRETIVDPYQIPKIGILLAGGEERQDSVRNGLEACGADQGDIVIIHDGVRPFFPQKMIRPLIDTAHRVGAAILAVPAQDTIKKVDTGRVHSTLDRKLLWMAQTPQAFCFDKIYQAHQQASQMGFRGTDDASLIEWCTWPVSVLIGHPYNIKITTSADLDLARAIVQTGEFA